MSSATTVIAALAPLVVAIALLWITLGIAKRYVASMGLPTGWMSITRIFRTGWRVLAGTIAGLWRAGRALSRFVQGRRKMRRLPGRTSIVSPRRSP
jgi:hypothetical protein